MKGEPSRVQPIRSVGKRGLKQKNSHKKGHESSGEAEVSIP